MTTSEPLESKSSLRDLYLFAMANRHEFSSHLRMHGVEDAIDQHAKLLLQWESIQDEVQEVLNHEKGIAETIAVNPIHEEFQEVVRCYTSDPLFIKTFGSISTTVVMVEIDKLVAAQRNVNLDQVDRIVQSLPNEPKLRDIFPLALNPMGMAVQINHLETDRMSHIFTSASQDLRFLGSFKKVVTETDLGFALYGGFPVTAVISFIGFGNACINAYRVGRRVVLHNGFHRVYALRQLGFKEIPMVLQNVQNPAIEFPSVVSSLPRDYLLGAPRPAIMADFFRERFTTKIRMRRKMRVVTLNTAAMIQDVPV